MSFKKPQLRPSRKLESTSAFWLHSGKPKPLIAEIELKPNDTPTFSLGRFTKDDKLKGFCIELDASTNEANSVRTEIIERPVLNALEYLLRITNNSNKTLSVEIWRL